MCGPLRRLRSPQLLASQARKLRGIPRRLLDSRRDEYIRHPLNGASRGRLQPEHVQTCLQTVVL